MKYGIEASPARYQVEVSIGVVVAVRLTGTELSDGVEEVLGVVNPLEGVVLSRRVNPDFLVRLFGWCWKGG